LDAECGSFDFTFRLANVLAGVAIYIVKQKCETIPQCRRLVTQGFFAHAVAAGCLVFQPCSGGQWPAQTTTWPKTVLIMNVLLFAQI
jgi:hypothetical protein